MSDEWIISALVAVVGAIRVAIQIASGQAFGGSATLGLLMLVLGMAGLGWAARGALHARHARRT